MSFIPVLERGFAAHQAGQIVEAEQLYQQVLALEPNQPDALHLLGVIAYQRGQPASAAELIRRAIRVYPHSAEMHKNLGLVLLSLRQFAEAEASFHGCLQLAPHDAEVWHQLATAQRAQAKLAESEQSCREAIRCRPDHADALDQLGRLIQFRGGYAEAEDYFRRAIAAQPQHVSARVNLATSASAAGHWSEAQRLFQEALQIHPNHLHALVGFGSMLHDQGLSAEGAAILERAVNIDPKHAGARAALGTVLQKVGRTEDARAQLAESLRLKPSSGVQMRLALMSYIIAPSSAELRANWERCQSDLAVLEAAPPKIDNPLTDVGDTPFFFAYQAVDTRSLLERIAGLYRRTSPRLEYVAPHCRPGQSVRPVGAPLRVGVISKFFHDHPVGKFYLELLRQLDRTRFHVTALTMSHVDDAVSRALPTAADRVVKVGADLWLAHEQIASEQLDVLIYTDIGMDPWTYLLAFARLAPVQCVLPGHPITTGMKTLDYYISSQLMEPSDGAEHYSEQLVQLESLPSAMPRPQLPASIGTRAELGLPLDGNLYMSAQTVYKYHPDYDDLWGHILRGDPHGRVIIFAGRIDEWTKRLQRRLQTALGDVYDRVVWKTRVSHEEYLQAISHAAALLDPPAFNGGTTSVEAVAAGVPIVTLPGPFMRMRTTLGVYRLIGVTDTVAQNAAEYVAIALRLAHDPAWRESIVGRIRAGSGKLFEENPARFVQELQQWLIKLRAKS